MLFGGIDPGKAGALAIIDQAGAVLQLLSTPMIPSATGSREEYDLMTIRRELMVWRPEGLFVTVEKLHPLPARFRRKGGAEQHGGGGIANFNRGLSHGWAWMLAGLGIPFLPVLPRVWQRVMLDGIEGDDTKARSVAAARRIWLAIDLRRTERSRVPHDAFSDALLLAEFGRRRRLGGEVFAAAERGKGA